MIQGKAKTILTIVVLAFVIVISIYGSMEPSVTVKDNQLKISGLHGVTLGLDEVKEIKEVTDNNIPVGTRMFGLGFGSIRKGRFRYGENGSAKVLLVSSSGPYIFITTKDDLIILNFKKGEKTQQVYNYLKETIKK